MTISPTAFHILADYVLAVGSELLEAKKRESDAFDAWFEDDGDETLYHEYTRASRRCRKHRDSFEAAMYLLRGECTSESDRLAVFAALRNRGASDVARLVEFR
jgi:hypothetical protein